MIYYVIIRTLASVSIYFVIKGFQNAMLTHSNLNALLLWQKLKLQKMSILKCSNVKNSCLKAAQLYQRKTVFIIYLLPLFSQYLNCASTFKSHFLIDATSLTSMTKDPLFNLLQDDNHMTILYQNALLRAQLPGRIFSPSDKCKKLSHHFLLHFPIGMGFL